MTSSTTIKTADSVQDIKKKTVSGAISYTLRSLFLYSFGIGTAIILGAYLEPEDYGVYGIVTQIVALLQFFSSVGLGPVLIQQSQEPKLAEYRTVFTIQQLLSWIIFLITLILVGSGLLDSSLTSEGQLVLLALAFSFPLDSLRLVPSLMMERALNFSKLILPNMVEQVIYNILLVFLVVYFQLGVSAYAYAVIVRGVIGVIVTYLIQPWQIGFQLEPSIVRRFLRTGLQFQTSDILARVKDQLFFLFLGRVLPLHQFGYISWAKSWSQMPYMLTVQNVIAITFPTYSKLKSDTVLLRKAIEKTIYFVSLSIFPLLTGMVIFISPFVQLIPKYNKWQPAVLTFILFTLSIGWAAISTPLTNTLNAIGRISDTLKLMVMWTILTWVLTIPLINWFGFEGVAIASFLISFTSVFPIIMVRRVLYFDVWRNVRTQLAGCVVMAGVGFGLLGLLERSFVGLVLAMISTALTYVVVVLLMDWRYLQLQIQGLRSNKGS